MGSVSQYRLLRLKDLCTGIACDFSRHPLTTIKQVSGLVFSTGFHMTVQRVIGVLVQLKGLLR